MEVNKIYCMDNVDGMSRMGDESVDLCVTSPPYSNLRDYKKCEWDFYGVSKQVFRILKKGGVLVWVVGDKTERGSESGESFRQALAMMDAGFSLHDTMLYKRISPFPPNVRYWQVFEYMFVFSKGKPKTFNPIMQGKTAFDRGHFSARQKNGGILKESGNVTIRLENAKKVKQRIKDNIWEIGAGWMKSSPDKIAYKHPAIFPEQLAKDHILSWSNPGDLILDPFMGSGTTAKMALLTGRNYIGFEISQEYVDLANERLKIYTV